MIYGSVCSGIEAASQAWKPRGWEAAFFSEIEKFPSAVLAHHYGSNMPDEPYSQNGVPNYGDMTKFEEWPDHAIDLLVGGTPCQDFSIAGLRKGLEGLRGQLMLTYLAIARRYRARWLVWENVPGVLSSNGGQDFASFLGLAAGVAITPPADGWKNAGIIKGYRNAYGLAYRVLDTQYVRTHRFPRALPQRRRRVFVIGYLGDWRRAAAVLFERHGLQGNPAPRREAGKGVAPTLNARTKGGGGLGTDLAKANDSLDCSLETYVPEVTGALNTANGKTRPGDTLQCACSGFTLPVAFDCKGTEVQTAIDGVAPPLRSMGHLNSHQNAGGHAAISGKFGVRRLTPIETGRLQGFPDGHTAIPWRGKPADQCPDGHQWKAHGNSMSVNVKDWLGERIDAVDALFGEEGCAA